MNFELLHAAEQLSRMMARVYNRGLTCTCGGNISIKDENGDVWITPSGIDKKNLRAEDIVRITPDGEVIGKHKPSIEVPFHTLIYGTDPTIKAVLHAHSPALTLYSLMRLVPDVDTLPDLQTLCPAPGIAKFALPSTEQLGKNLEKEYQNGYRQVLLENHGVCVSGTSLPDAFVRFEAMEHAANIGKQVSRVGAPVHLTKEQLSAFHNSYLDQAPETFENNGHTLAEREKMLALRELAARCYERRLLFAGLGCVAERTEGNDFVVTPERGDLISLGNEDMVAVRAGRAEAGKIPSHYTRLLAAIFEKNAEIGGIIIAQPESLMAFAVTNSTMDSRLVPETFRALHHIPNIPFAEAVASPEKIAETIGYLHPLLIIENVGIVLAEKTAYEAFVALEVAEDSAYALAESPSIGEIQLIDEADIAELKKVFDVRV